MVELVLVGLVGLMLCCLVIAMIRLRKATSARRALEERFRPIVDIDREHQRVRTEIDSARQRAAGEIEAERQRAAAEHQRDLGQFEGERQRMAAERSRLEKEHAVTVAQYRQLGDDIVRLRAEFAALDEESNLQSFGFYKPRYSFASSGLYQSKLDENRERQKMMLKDKAAAVCATEWQVNGSKAEGRKQINQTLKLMIRAFNGECDATTAKVRYNNVRVMEARILKAWEVINSLAEVQTCRITREYMELKLNELYLVHEYEEKVQAEKEEQRRIREQMREEELALREIERARAEAEKEEARFADALRKARADVDQASGQKQQKLRAQVAELERKLAEALVNKERAISRAQMTKSGHVYIISNIGSFGEHVYKIGMTRRVDPMDRVKELGDASVPFEFDVHAIIFTEDAPKLENELHKAFHHRRVNRVNERKEFFRVSLTEIADHVRRHHQATIELVHEAEAAEYRKTISMGSDEAADPKQAMIRRPPPLRERQSLAAS